MRQLISFSLKRFKNARIIEAVDGVDALKKLSGERIDLILTDINMPVMDGLKLVSLVRQNAQLQSIPIIIITTEGAEEDRERGLALGANAYISKPIQSSHLLKTISDLLSTGAIGYRPSQRRKRPPLAFSGRILYIHGFGRRVPADSRIACFLDQVEYLLGSGIDDLLPRM